MANFKFPKLFPILLDPRKDQSGGLFPLLLPPPTFPPQGLFEEKEEERKEVDFFPLVLYS